MIDLVLQIELRKERKEIFFFSSIFLLKSNIMFVPLNITNFFNVADNASRCTRSDCLHCINNDFNNIRLNDIK